MKNGIQKIGRLAAIGCLVSACNETGLAEKPEAPIAVVTGLQTYSPLDSALFDGSLSSAQEGAVITAYAWGITVRPNGSTSMAIPDPADPKLGRFWIDLAGDYVITLTVTDDRGLQGSAEYPFAAVPWQRVHVSLVWDEPGTDMDLHLVSENEGGTFFSEPFDCFFRNTNPDWGIAGEISDNPAIDIDDVDGFGPENASLNQPLPDHRYHVYAHYYDDYGHHASTATVRIYLSGLLRYEGIRPLSGRGDAWDVATIDWPSGDVLEVGSGFAHPP